MRGYGRLVVAQVDGLSAAIGLESRSPIKLLVPKPRGASVWAFVSSHGGGWVSGDQLELEVRVEAGATCFLGTQSSTKVYPARTGETVRASTTIHIGPGAALACLPDVVQGFAGARWDQVSRLHLAGPESSVAWLDWYGSGRLARGEAWAFDHFGNRLEIYQGSQRVLLDALVLASDGDGLSVAQRMGRFHCMAALMLMGPAWADTSSRLLSHVASEPAGAGRRVMSQASPLSGGVVARWAGESVDLVAQALRPHLAELAGRLGEDPFQRRL